MTRNAAQTSLIPLYSVRIFLSFFLCSHALSSNHANHWAWPGSWSVFPVSPSFYRGRGDLHLRPAVGGINPADGTRSTVAGAGQLAQAPPARLIHHNQITHPSLAPTPTNCIRSELEEPLRPPRTGLCATRTFRISKADRRCFAHDDVCPSEHDRMTDRDSDDVLFFSFILPLTLPRGPRTP